MIGYFIYKSLSEMPFWKKALLAGALITSMEECERNRNKPLDEIGYNQRPAIEMEYDER